MSHTQVIKVSLDGGLTYVEAKEGVRIIYDNVMLDGEDELGEVHINATSEGLITDIWASRETSLDHNIATRSIQLDDLVSEMIEEDA
jgi:hypothetical protein